MPASRFYPLLILALITAVVLLGFFIFGGSSGSPTVTASPLKQQAPPAPCPVQAVGTGADRPPASALPEEPAAGAAAAAGSESRAQESQAPALVSATGPGTRKTYVPSYFYDPFIPSKWRALPENTPLKRLVQQAVLPRPAGFQASSDPGKVEEAARSASKQVPAVFADASTQTGQGNTETPQEVALQDQFIEKVSGLPGKPTDAEYQRAWNRARLEADSQFAAMFGTGALEARRKTLLQNPE